MAVAKVGRDLGVPESCGTMLAVHHAARASRWKSGPRVAGLWLGVRTAVHAASAPPSLPRSSRSSSSDAIRARSAGRKGAFDFPTVDDGVEGMAFIETAVKSAQSNGKWTRFPKV